MQVLLRLCLGNIKALLRRCSDAVKALLRPCFGPVKALVRPAAYLSSKATIKAYSIPGDPPSTSRASPFVCV